MTDTIITMKNGKQYSPVKSIIFMHCQACENVVDTPEEIASYPDGYCPDCGNLWTGKESRSTSIAVTSPDPLTGN